MQGSKFEVKEVPAESIVPFVNAIPSSMDPKLKAKIQLKSAAEKRKKELNRKRVKAQRAARKRQRG